jgi:hypothetical protein
MSFLVIPKKASRAAAAWHILQMNRVDKTQAETRLPASVDRVAGTTPSALSSPPELASGRPFKRLNVSQLAAAVRSHQFAFDLVLYIGQVCKPTFFVCSTEKNNAFCDTGRTIECSRCSKVSSSLSRSLCEWDRHLVDAVERRSGL